MKKIIISLTATTMLFAPVVGIALAHPNKHACNGHGGLLNPNEQGLMRAEEVGGNVHCDFGGGEV